MYTKWTDHLSDPKEKEEFEKYLRGSCKAGFERLQDILDEQEKSIDRSEHRLETYDKPNWEFRQAHKNGSRATLQSLKRLLDLDQKIILTEG